MGPTQAGTISRRDAGVAAALTGAVLVILGYASGWGLTTTTAQAANLPIVQQTTPAPAPPAPEIVPMAPMLPATRIVKVPAAKPMTMPATTPVAPEPSDPTPPASDPGKACKPSLLESLGINLPLTGTVTSLVSSVLGSTSAGGASGNGESDPVTCLVGALIGPSCCGTTAVTILGGTR